SSAIRKAPGWRDASVRVPGNRSRLGREWRAGLARPPVGVDIRWEGLASLRIAADGLTVDFGDKPGNSSAFCWFESDKPGANRERTVRETAAEKADLDFTDERSARQAYVATLQAGACLDTRG